jgi:drug/metabolite transporter (DMT)-like permease
MTSVALGAGAACTASCMYNVGLALQALEARRTDRTGGLRPALLRRLVARPRWLAGTALNVLGWPLQAAALVLAPLTVVQPALAFGLLPLLVIGARRLGERVGARQLLATVAIVGGVAALASLAPDVSTRHARPAIVVAVLAALGAGALLPYALRRGARIGGGVAAVCAGLAFAWSGVSTKFVADALHRSHWAPLGAWAAATAVAAGIGLLSEMTALQRAPATRVAPVVFVVQVVVPVSVAPLLTGERWGHGAASTAGTVAALAVVVGAAVALLRSAALPAAVEASDVTGTGSRPRPARPDATAASSAPARASDAGTETTTTSPATTSRGT